MPTRRDILVAAAATTFAPLIAGHAGRVAAQGASFGQRIVKPKRLQPGDTVGLVIPSSATWDEIDRALGWIGAFKTLQVVMGGTLCMTAVYVLVSLVSLGQVSVFGDAAVKARLLLRFVVSDRALGNLRGCPFWRT